MWNWNFLQFLHAEQHLGSSVPMVSAGWTRVGVSTALPSSWVWLLTPYFLAPTCCHTPGIYSQTLTCTGTVSCSFHAPRGLIHVAFLRECLLIIMDSQVSWLSVGLLPCSQDTYVNSGSSWEQWWLIGSDTRLWNCSPGFKSNISPAYSGLLSWDGLPSGMALCCRLSSERLQRKI